MPACDRDDASKLISDYSLFLPVTLLGYFMLGEVGNVAPVVWSALASLVFYLITNWQFVLMQLALIAFSYLIGLLLLSKRLRPGPRALTISVVGDLLTIGYFKYTGLLAANLNAIFSAGLNGRYPASGRDFILLAAGRMRARPAVAYNRPDRSSLNEPIPKMVSCTAFLSSFNNR